MEKRYQKHPLCPHGDLDYIDRQREECFFQCRVENQGLYAECMEMQYGPEQAAKMLGKSPKQENPEPPQKDPPPDGQAKPTKTQPDDKPSNTPAEKQIQKKLDLYDQLNEDGRKEYYESEVRENERLRHSNRVKGGKLASQRFGFNRRLVEGRNRIIALKYADAIMVHMVLLPEIIKESYKENNGKGSFEFLHETNGKRLGKRFGIDVRKARKIIKELVEMGAMKKVKTLRDRHVIYKVGERKWTGQGFVDTILFNLSNPAVKAFFTSKKTELK